MEEAESVIAECHKKMVDMENEPLPVLKPILDTTNDSIMNIASQNSSGASISMLERRRILKEVSFILLLYLYYMSNYLLSLIRNGYDVWMDNDQNSLVAS